MYGNLRRQSEPFRSCLYEGGHLGSGLALDGLLCCDENPLANDFAAISDACWLAIVTMTTVGYGDKYPRSRLGQVTMNF